MVPLEWSGYRVVVVVPLFLSSLFRLYVTRYVLFVFEAMSYARVMTSF